MWELYAMWTWMPAFAAASIAAGGGTPERTGSLVAFVAIASGAAGCVLAGLWADAWGKARVAGVAMVTSAACAASASLVFGGPAPLLFALAIVWGFSVVADSAQFSALVAEFSPRTHVGTALTLQTCAGFLLTLVTLRGLPAVADVVGWQWAFWVLVPGPILGALAMRRLSRP
jgi:MFS family permease